MVFTDCIIAWEPVATTLASDHLIELFYILPGRQTHSSLYGFLAITNHILNGVHIIDR